MKEEKAKQYMTFTIFILGMVLLFAMWELQKSISGILGELLALIVYLAGFFYFFALIPIREFVDSFFDKKNK